MSYPSEGGRGWNEVAEQSQHRPENGRNGRAEAERRRGGPNRRVSQRSGVLGVDG